MGDKSEAFSTWEGMKRVQFSTNFTLQKMRDKTDSVRLIFTFSH